MAINVTKYVVSGKSKNDDGVDVYYDVDLKIWHGSVADGTQFSKREQAEQILPSARVTSIKDGPPEITDVAVKPVQVQIG